MSSWLVPSWVLQNDLLHGQQITAYTGDRRGGAMDGVLVWKAG